MSYLYDLHVHTSKVSACAIASPVEQVHAYKDCGYAGIIVTDHFINGNSSCPREWPWEQKMRYFYAGYAEAKAEGEKCGLDVFFGWEYCLDGTEFLTYGLELDFLLAHPNVDRLTVEEYSALVRACGGYLAQAHPYRNQAWVRNPYPVDAKLLDGMEVYNAGMPADGNAKAYTFARENHLPMQAGSDSHRTDLPFASGIRLAEKAKNVFDIINAIKTGRAELIVP